MKNSNKSNFVKELRMKGLSLQYFISEFDRYDEEMKRDCLHLTLYELRQLQDKAIKMKASLRWYNLLDRMRAYDCLVHLDELIDARMYCVAFGQDRSQK